MSMENSRYRYLKKLGQGGFGITYLALDQENGQKVVIKKYTPSGEEAQKRKNGQKSFLREARIMASLKPVPEIVRVLNYFAEGESAYIVMEYVQGTSLRDYMECLDEPMDFTSAADMLSPVMDALEKVHKKHILHRDLTPDNLLVRENGKLCVIDFGSAREFDQYDRTKTVLLKNGYAPFEQYSSHGKQKPWTDVYSLCAVLYEMITGVIPQDGLSRADRDQLYPPSMYGAVITPEEEQALLKGLSVDCRKRYSSMGELKAALTEAAGEKTQSFPAKRKKIKWIAAAGCAALLLAAGTGLRIKNHYFSEQSGQTVYAGNFYRGSKEEKEFLSFVKNNAVSSEKDSQGEGTRYILKEEKVKEYGLPCNQFRFLCTIPELEKYMKENQWIYSTASGDSSFTAEIGKLGAVKTDFRKQIVYQAEDFLVMEVEYDPVDEKILEVRADMKRKGRISPEETGAKLMGFLEKKDPGESMQRQIAACDRKFLSGEYPEDYLCMIQWGNAQFIFQKADRERLKARILPGNGDFFAQEFAWWP